MHRSLQIPEILEIVISKLFEPHANEIVGDWYSDYNCEVRASLARLARTCCTFRDPALDVLWSSLKSFDPLIRCLPRDLWMHDDDGFLEFTRPLRASDWVIFQRYAQRVRIFGNDDSGLPLFESVPYDLVDALSGFLADGDCFLPNLRQLDWTCPQHDAYDPSDVDYYPLLPFFLSPCLTGISMGFGLTSVPTSLHVSVPLIKHFKCEETSERLMGNISENISQWRYLEYVETGALSQEAITHLCSLKSLKHLGVRLDQHHHYTYANFPPTLESFAMFAPYGSLAACQQYLEGVHLAAGRLSVTPPADKVHTASAFEQLFAFLPSRFSTSNLHTLELPSVLGTPCTGYPPLVWSLETIKPLFAFKNMTVFHSRNYLPGKLSDSDVEKIALAWPQLEVFVLGTLNPKQPPSLITFKGFLSMLRHCHRLWKIGLVIDATDVGPVTNQGLGTHIVNANVTHFDVGCSDIRDAASVAAFLSAVTPRLAVIETSWLLGDAMMSRKTTWEHVWRLLRLGVPAS
ncbi:hypothetical protein BV22DRAFT_1034622 [Leucogyrophana mollusca]|uniref:Uncharacterized protein n=1 Tax=Leucogyrophana mollusca TaxID=85980 RepID=A0ACB8BGP3_9AGAM|nr:hypothetical protein BV22DRAFT_1034622 [Leucogyrophana mollusca]